MRAFAGQLISIAAIALGACGLGAAEQKSETPQWQLASDSGGVQIYNRPHPGSSLKEFRAIGIIDAPTQVLHNVLNDVDGYPKFMPYTAECRVLKREGNSIYAYQRIATKIVSDRDYTIHIVQKSWPSERGTVFSEKWQPANDVGPKEKQGVLRVKVSEGSWLLEPESSDKTRATYSIYTDSGGSLPAFLANVASGMAIRKIFVAIREQVKDPKYRTNRDFLESRQ